MCEPTTIALIASAAISTATSIYASNEQADFQEASNKIANDMSEKQHDLNQGALSAQQAEAQESSAREQLRARQVAAEDQAKLKAAQSERGVMGTSVNEQLTDFKLQESRYIEALKRTNELQQAGLSRQKRGAQMGQEITSFGLIQKENKIGALEGAIRIGTASANAYVSGASIRKSKQS